MVPHRAAVGNAQQQPYLGFVRASRIEAVGHSMAHRERGHLLEFGVAEKLAVGFLDGSAPEPLLAIRPIGLDLEALAIGGQKEPAGRIETSVFSICTLSLPGVI